MERSGILGTGRFEALKGRRWDPGSVESTGASSLPVLRDNTTIRRCLLLFALMNNSENSIARIAGGATPAATAEYSSRFPELTETFHTLGSTGLICSAVGFGTYRVDHRVPTHRAALASALRRGVNVIDTSANYADGNSERLIGEVLQSMTELGVIKREEVIIVSKGGYIQGENYKRIFALTESEDADLSSGSEFSELTSYGPDLWHSIHPDFLKDQITRSLERLQLESIDLYLLHNPEYYIQWAIKEDVPEDEARSEYERRIKQAFEYLENEVTDGRIGYYGISSNTFPKPEGSADRTSLEQALRAADQIAARTGKPHHFAAIQLPLNLLETGGVSEHNQARGSKSVIEFAREHGVGVLINRPLNALWRGTLFRLSDFPAREYPPVDDVDEMVHDLSLQEEEFKTGLLKELAMNPQAYDAVKQLLGLGKSLDGQWNKLNSYEEWKDVSQTVLAPRIQYVFDLLRPLSKTNKEVFNFLTTYAEAADEVLEHITNFYTTEANKRSEALHDLLDQMMPDEYEGLSLSQKATLIARSIPGVSSVLVGMRSEEYVDDVLFGLQAKVLPNAEELLKKLKLERAGME
jgi:aryl-alcohol dehydrogenase-like predicted oxidoreductase